MPKVARRGLIAAVVAIIGALAVASVTSATATVNLSASRSKLAFNKKTLRVKLPKDRKVRLVMANPSSFPHAVSVEGHGIDKDGKTVNKGGTSRVTVKLKKGTYTFYCPVDGHKAAGMKGKLIVS